MSVTTLLQGETIHVLGNNDIWSNDKIEQRTFFEVEKMKYVIYDYKFIFHMSQGYCKFCKGEVGHSNISQAVCIVNTYSNKDFYKSVLNKQNELWIQDIHSSKDTLKYNILHQFGEDKKYHVVIQFLNNKKAVDLIFSMNEEHEILVECIKTTYNKVIDTYITTKIIPELIEENKLSILMECF